MKELPLLFSPAMVCALLDDRKTVTRRLRFTGGRGDRIWVKETWRTEERASDMTDGIRFRADGAFVPIANTNEAADMWGRDHNNGKHGEKWRPSIFMRRWASRFLLEVVDVREEPLHAIDEADVLREGLKRLSKDGGRTMKFGIPDRDGWPGTDDFGMPWHEWDTDAVRMFGRLWDGLNAKRGAPFASNPTVKRVEFRMVEADNG